MHSKHFLRFPSSVTDGKWLAGNKLSWYHVLLHLTIQFCTIQRRFTDDYLYQKLLILVQICWKYLRILQGSGFFRHSVDRCSSLMTLISSIARRYRYIPGVKNQRNLGLSGKRTKYPCTKSPGQNAPALGFFSRWILSWIRLWNARHSAQDHVFWRKVEETAALHDP